MARTPILRNLPPLEQILGPFQGYPLGRSRLQTMADQLRVVAKSIRREKAQAFYSMRSVSAYFGANIGTTTRVYQVLEREGILSRLRSSRTMLTGRKTSSQDQVRGIVGVPIWINSLALLPFTRTFARELSERLRTTGFVADYILYHRKEEEADNEFAERLLRHRLDVVIFHSPLAEIRQNLVTLRERGVRVIVIERGEHQAVGMNFPVVMYHYEFESAYRKMAQSWISAGVRKVWLCYPRERNHAAVMNRLSTIFSSYGFELESIADEPQILLKNIKRQASGKHQALAFVDYPEVHKLIINSPLLLEKISRVARIAFCSGRITYPYLRDKGIPVDIIDYSALEIAVKLVNDIVGLPILHDGLRHTFRATYEEQTIQSYVNDLIVEPA